MVHENTLLRVFRISITRDWPMPSEDTGSKAADLKSLHDHRYQASDLRAKVY